MNFALTVRAFFLLLATTCSHISSIAPTRQQNVQVGATKAQPPLEKFMRIGVIALLKYFRISLWIIAIAEIATITATGFPSSRISNLILSILTFEGEEGHIRLTTATVVSGFVSTFGTMLRLRCYRELGKYFTFEFSIQEDHVLVTTGPYSFVRHPSYTGIVLNVLGLYLLHGTRGSWVRESGLMQTVPGSLFVYGLLAFTLMSVAGVYKRMYVEDKELRARFGRKWDDWASRVPYALVPGIV